MNTSIRKPAGVELLFLLMLVTLPTITEARDYRSHVKTETYLGAPAGDSIESVQYYDGWGRPTLSCTKGVDVTHPNVSTYRLSTYNPDGLKSMTWLPVSASDSDFTENEPDVFRNLSETFYSDSTACVETDYDELGNILSQTMPGEAWHRLDKATTHEYGVNLDSVIHYYAPVGDNGLSVKSKKYSPGTLHVVTDIGPDGIRESKYYDLSGRVILERRGDSLDTYYVYNDYNQLRFVLPPEMSGKPVGS